MGSRRVRFFLALIAVLLWATPAEAANQLTDIACETSTTAGTGTLNLAGAKDGGYLGFAAAGITSGNSVPYSIVTGTGATRKLETGLGQFTDGSPDTLTRVAEWSSDGTGAELTLSETSTVCIGLTAGFLQLGAGNTIDADKLDGISSADFLTEAEAAAAYQPLGVTLGTDTTGNYVADVADGTGIDGTATGEGSTYTPTFDATELTGTTTFGDGSASTVVAGDLSSGDDVLVGDDVTLSAADGVVSIGTDVTFTRVDASDSLVIQADVDNDGASSVISLGVDGSGEALLSGTAFYPGADGGNALGITDTNEWNGLFLNSGTAISWNASDVLITHSANDLAFTGVTGDYSFDDTVGVTGSVTASVDVTATAGDVTSGDDIIAGDDVNLSGANPAVNFTDTDTNADSRITADSGSGSLTIDADLNAESASSVIVLGVDGTQEWSINSSRLAPIADGSEDIGTTALGVNNLHFDTGATITFENTDCVLTHASNSLALTGACTLANDSRITGTSASFAAGTSTTYAIGVDSNGLTFASDGSFGYIQTWGGDTLWLNSQGNALIYGTGSDPIKYTGVQTLWIPAASMTPRTTSGCAATTRETNSITVSVLACDTAADEAAQFTVAMPKNWNEGTMTFAPYWTAASGSGTVDWELSCAALSNDDAITSATLGTAVASNDTLIAANDVHIGPTSSAMTVGGTPAVADLLVCMALRDVSDDTLGVDAELLGFKIFYTDDAANDD
jgi:hypothetical protein